MATKDLIISGLFVAAGLGAAHVRASKDWALRRQELLAMVGSFAAAAGVSFLATHPGWWPFPSGRLFVLLVSPLLVGLATWAVGEVAIRWSRHPLLGLIGAIVGMGLAMFATGRFDPGPISAKMLFLPLMAGAFGGYQVACGGRRKAAPSGSSA